jgi:hypothetical protein
MAELFVRVQANVEALKLGPATTDQEVSEFDRDFRVTSWMRNAGGALVRDPGGTTRWVSKEEFEVLYSPQGACGTADELPLLLGTTLAHMKPRPDARFCVVFIEVSN